MTPTATVSIIKKFFKGTVILKIHYLLLIGILQNNFLFNLK